MKQNHVFKSLLLKNATMFCPNLMYVTIGKVALKFISILRDSESHTFTGTNYNLIEIRGLVEPIM